MNVKNINGTLHKTCKCGSWLQHWKNFSGRTAKVCQAKSCIGTDLVGAHVQKDVDSDDTWYIVPLCHSHNRTLGLLELVMGAMLVPTDTDFTCGSILKNKKKPKGFFSIGRFKV